MKKILHLDMDGVIADFNQEIIRLCPDLETGENYSDSLIREQKVESLCIANPQIFENLEPIEGAISSVNTLFDFFDVYFLSTPMWNLPTSFSGKRIWLEKHFGEKIQKRLILTHRKDLVIGDFLVDDRLKHGVTEFKGMHIHFGNEIFPNWEETLKFLKLHC